MRVIQWNASGGEPLFHHVGGSDCGQLTERVEIGLRGSRAGSPAFKQFFGQGKSVLRDDWNECSPHIIWQF